MDRDALYHHATDVRYCFERGDIDLSILRDLYPRYEPPNDIDLLLERAQQLFPHLNCGLASVYLQSQLGGEVVRGFYKGHPHTFLLIDHSTIVDITADQFGGPGVYVGTSQEPWSSVQVENVP